MSGKKIIDGLNEAIARKIAHEWVRDCDSTTIKMRAMPDVIDPLIDAIASALLAARAEERAKAMEEAETVIKNLAASIRADAEIFADRDMDAAHHACMDRVWAMDECAAAIRARAEKEIWE